MIIIEGLVISLPHALFLFVGIIIFLKVVKSYVRWYTSPLWHAPIGGPRRRLTGWFFGNFPEIMKAPLLECHERWRREANNGPMIHYSMLLGAHVVMVFDADVVSKVLYSTNRFVKSFPLLTDMVGENIITMRDGGKKWKRHRRIIHPCFQTRLISDTLEKCVPIYVNRLIACWKACEGKEIDIWGHFSSLTLDIIGKTAFNHDFCAVDSIEKWAFASEKSKDNNEYLDRDNSSIEAFNFRRPPIRTLLAFLGLVKFDFITQRVKAKLNRVVDDIIESARFKVILQMKNEDASSSSHSSQKKQEKSNSNNRSTSKYTAAISLLEVLLQAEENSKDLSMKGERNYLSNQELRDEMRGFILAGHDTTSTWIYWCSYILCKYPDVQQKVYEDIVKHAPSSYDIITLQMTNQMSYLGAFMKEILRLYPPIGITFRITTQEETFNGINIPRHTKISIPIQTIHRDPKYWSRPEDFLPERWLKDDFPANNKHAFLPFGTGPRGCIGYQFATMEAQLIMAPLIRTFNFTLAPSLRDTEFKLSSFITTRTKPLVKIHVSSRE